MTFQDVKGNLTRHFPTCCQAFVGLWVIILIDHITLMFGGARKIFKRNGKLYRQWVFMTSSLAAGETAVPVEETPKEFYMIFNDCLLSVSN